MLEYRIVGADNHIDLQLRVEEDIRKRGWLPQGGVCVISKPATETGVYYYQAMVKEVKNAGN